MNYTIRRGDTLSALANRFHTTVGALAKANGIKNVNLIYTGAKLHVDGFDRPKSPSAPAHKPSKPSGPDAPSGSIVGGKIHATAAMKRLAEAGKQVALSMGGYRGQGWCATGVSRAVSRALGLSVHGNGNQIDNNLPKSKFKQVHMSLAEALKIPGLILTWERTSSTLGAKYGHTAITTGDGRSSTSDFIERDTLHAGGRSGLKIFVPI